MDMEVPFECPECKAKLKFKLREMYPGNSVTCACGAKINFTGDDMSKAQAAVAFAADLRSRVLNRPQITSDGFSAYLDAVEQAFGCEVDYGQAIKVYNGANGEETDDHRYSQGRVRAVTKRSLLGNPDEAKMTTSHIERQNMSVRMGCRRFTRLTNAFSKSLRHLRAAVALHYVYGNLCRVHMSLRVTPAMQAGLTGHVWGLDELLEAVLENPTAPTRAPTNDPSPGVDQHASTYRRPALRVLRGGRP